MSGGQLDLLQCLFKSVARVDVLQKFRSTGYLNCNAILFIT